MMYACIRKRSRRSNNWRLPAFADLSTSGPPPIPARPSAPPPVPAPNVRPGMPTFGILAIIGGVGIVCVITFGIVMAAIMTPAFIRAREVAGRSQCKENLSRFALAFKWYAEDHEGRLPLLGPAPGCFSVVPGTLYPEHMDLSAFTCPSDESADDGTNKENATRILKRNSYAYLGYVLLNEKEGQAFIEACRAHFAEGKTLSGEISVPEGTGSGGGSLLFPLTSDVYTRLPQAADGKPVTAASIPILMDKQPYHTPGGICVLYLDGHVEFIRMGEKWPADQDFLDAIVKLEAQYAPVEEE